MDKGSQSPERREGIPPHQQGDSNSADHLQELRRRNTRFTTNPQYFQQQQMDVLPHQQPFPVGAIDPQPSTRSYFLNQGTSDPTEWPIDPTLLTSQSPGHTEQRQIDQIIAQPPASSTQHHDQLPPHQGYGAGSSTDHYNQAPFDSGLSIQPTAAASVQDHGQSLLYQDGSQSYVGPPFPHSDTNLHTQEQSSSGFGPRTTASGDSSWYGSQDNYPPSTIWSRDVPQYARTYPSSSHGRESYSFSEQTHPSEVQDHTHENTSSSHLKETLQNMLTYPVTSLDDNNQHSTIEYPIGGGNPNSSYAFIDMQNPINPLYFTNDFMDQRYNDSQRYVLLSHTEGKVRLYTPQDAYNYNTEQRNQRSQISQIAINTHTDNSTTDTGKSQYQLRNEKLKMKTGKSQSQLRNEKLMRETGKTESQLRDEKSKRNTGKSRYQLRNDKLKMKTGKTESKLLDDKLKMKTGKSRYQLRNEKLKMKTGKTESKLRNEKLMRETGKTESQLRNEKLMRETGKSKNEIGKMAKALNVSGKIVRETLTLLKQLEEVVAKQKKQQKPPSGFIQYNDETVSINGRRAQIHNVPGDGMNCLLYAILAANGHNIHAEEIKQIVTNTRTFLQVAGRAHENELLDMDTTSSQGAEALAYFRSMGYIDHNSGITIHATWQNPQDHQTYTARHDVIPSQNSVPPTELYLDLAEHHYYYIQYLD